MIICRSGATLYISICGLLLQWYHYTNLTQCFGLVCSIYHHYLVNIKKSSRNHTAHILVILASFLSHVSRCLLLFSLWKTTIHCLNTWMKTTIATPNQYVACRNIYVVKATIENSKHLHLITPMCHTRHKGQN